MGDEEDLNAAKIISRSWLAYRDKQIYQILRGVISVAEQGYGRLLLSRLSPNEAELMSRKNDDCIVRLRLAGTSFPPKVVFKVWVRKTAVCYLSGRRTLNGDQNAIDGAIKMMGSRNFYAQMTSDLLERKRNGNIVDEVDIGTPFDRAKFTSYQDSSPSVIGGKDNGWRHVDLSTLPRAAPLRDIYETVQIGALSALPKTFWMGSRNREHLLAQLQILIDDNKKLVIPTPTSAKPNRKRKGQSEKMRALYSSDSGEMSDCGRGYGQIRPETTSNSIKIIDLDVGPELWEEEARQLYEWSQDLKI